MRVLMLSLIALAAVAGSAAGQGCNGGAAGYGFPGYAPSIAPPQFGGGYYGQQFAGQVAGYGSPYDYPGRYRLVDTWQASPATSTAYYFAPPAYGRGGHLDFNFSLGRGSGGYAPPFAYSDGGAKWPAGRGST